MVDFDQGIQTRTPAFVRVVKTASKSLLLVQMCGARPIGQSTRASENAKKAFDLRERVSEREKYRISAFYYGFVTGELDKENQAYEVWKQSYPRDFLPFVNMGDTYMRLGQWEKALRETQDGIRLEPNSAVMQAT